MMQGRRHWRPLHGDTLRQQLHDVARLGLQGIAVESFNFVAIHIVFSPLNSTNMILFNFPVCVATSVSVKKKKKTVADIEARWLSRALNCAAPGCYPTIPKYPPHPGQPTHLTTGDADDSRTFSPALV